MMTKLQQSWGSLRAWAWPGAWLGWFVAAVFVAPKLQAAGVMTVPEYCEVRFGSRSVRAVAAVVIVIAYTVYLVLASQRSASLETYANGMIWFVIPLTVLTLGIVTVREARRKN